MHVARQGQGGSFSDDDDCNNECSICSVTTANGQRNNKVQQYSHDGIPHPAPDLRPKLALLYLLYILSVHLLTFSKGSNSPTASCPVSAPKGEGRDTNFSSALHRWLGSSLCPFSLWTSTSIGSTSATETWSPLPPFPLSSVAHERERGNGRNGGTCQSRWACSKYLEHVIRQCA